MCPICRWLLLMWMIAMAGSAAAETPESILLEQASERLLQEAIEQLPLPFREVLLLCDVEEMSYQEISAALSIPTICTR